MICKQYAKTVQTGYPNARQCRFVCTRAICQSYGKADRAAIPQKLTLAQNEHPRPLPEKTRHSAGRWSWRPAQLILQPMVGQMAEEALAPDPSATDGRCRRGTHVRGIGDHGFLLLDKSALLVMRLCSSRHDREERTCQAKALRLEHDAEMSGRIVSKSINPQLPRTRSSSVTMSSS